MNTISKLIKWYNRKFKGVVYAEDSKPEGTFEDYLETIDVQVEEEIVRSLNKVIRR